MLDMFRLMPAGQTNPQKTSTRGHARGPNAGNEQALLAQALRSTHGARFVAQDDRNDLAGGGSDTEAGSNKAFAEQAGVR